MAKRLQYSGRKEMIKDRNRGLTDTEIKSKFGITDDRTLKRHLRLGEQEEEARSVKIEILKDALTSHLAEICRLMEQWRRAVMVPLIYEISNETVSQTHRFESDALFGSLKEHVPSPTLWRRYGIWRNQLQTFVTEYEQLKQAVEEEAGKWGISRLFKESPSAPILKRLNEKVKGREPKAHGFEKSVEHEYVHGKAVREFEILLVDGLTTVEANDALPYQAKYQELSDRIAGSTTAADLINQYNDLKSAGTKIDEYLWQILVRHDYIMYTCKLCPGQTRLLR
ncbi:MAG: hypothetical protein MUO99_08745 [Dehalococcoidales bacterium]|nr:hypothetical protein [Dehalococcoidales bacterium]